MGLLSWFFRRNKNLPLEGNVAFIGLSFAGKTTILNRLKTQEFEEDTVSTLGLNVDRFEYNDIIFSAFDLGGQDTFRMIWEAYLRSAIAVCYVIDSSAPELFSESAEVLHKALKQIPKQATLLLLANKSDLADVDALGQILKIFQFKKMQETANLQRINLFYISAKTGDQFVQAFEWLSQSVANYIKMNLKKKKEKISI